MAPVRRVVGRVGRASETTTGFRRVGRSAWWRKNPTERFVCGGGGIQPNVFVLDEEGMNLTKMGRCAQSISQAAYAEDQLFAR